MTPSISVIIAAHDEAAEIGGRLDDLLAPQSGHPPLEVVVASDGSTDGTDDIVAAYADRGVVLVSLPRVGKADALTAAVAASHGDILVFTDANTRSRRAPSPPSSRRSPIHRSVGSPVTRSTSMATPKRARPSGNGPTGTSTAA